MGVGRGISDSLRQLVNRLQRATACSTTNSRSTRSSCKLSLSLSLSVPSHSVKRKPSQAVAVAARSPASLLSHCRGQSQGRLGARSATRYL